jgi:hypothetical protein
LALGLLMALAVGLGLAQGPSLGEQARPEGTEGLAEEVGGSIPIQGRLTDADGHPLDGDYSITLGLYDDPVAGAELCSYTEVVPVTNGLFKVYIGGVCALPGVFTGDQLYLGIKVAGDEEMVPRQPIYPVPYAKSLQPGARIQGSVGGSALWVENTQSTDDIIGVHGRAASPDGYGGYFDNDGGGYALGVGGGMEMSVNATGAKSINVGDRYRDNAIIAWAIVNSDGSIGWDFGVTQVIRAGPGNYIVEIDAETVGTTSFMPIAIAQVESQPDSAGKARIVSINQTSNGIFRVYINNGNWAMVDNQFIFMVTGR